MENLSNVEIWLTKTCKPSSKQTYAKEINAFSKFIVENFKLDINTLKEQFRTAKYTNEIEKERFLDKIHDVVEAYACHIKQFKYSSMHEALILSILRSYLVKACGMRDVEITLPKHVFVTYHNRDLTREDIKQILDQALPRDKAFFLLMLESGARPDTLCKLKYVNIKQDFEKGTVPMKIELPALILKDNPQDRFSFIGEDGIHALKAYLGNRKLEDNEPIFTPIRPGKTVGNFGTEAFSNAFGRIVLRLGLVQRGKSKQEAKPRELRLYGLRKYFNNNMKADRAYIEFWMGHTDTKSHYISNDPETHRKIYAEGYQFLRIYEPLTDTAKTIQVQQNEIEKLKNEVDKITKSNKMLYDMFMDLLTVEKEDKAAGYVRYKPKGPKSQRIIFVRPGSEMEQHVKEILKEEKENKEEKLKKTATKEKAR
jgi:integrase